MPDNSNYRYLNSCLGDYEVVWCSGLRSLLRLWPEPTPNIGALLQCIGEPYDTSRFLEVLVTAQAGAAVSAGAKIPRDARSVRNTLQVLTAAGLAMRDSSDILVLTELGRQVLSFLGLVGGTKFANESNLVLVAEPLVRGLSVLVEIRAIWMLMRLSDNALSNEELNRSMSEVGVLSDIPSVAAKVRRSRIAGDPTLIGERHYEPEKYSSPDSLDQRKVMNPLFALAGAGGVLIEDQADGLRTLSKRMIGYIDAVLTRDSPLMHMSVGTAKSDQARAEFMSKMAGLTPAGGGYG